MNQSSGSFMLLKGFGIIQMQGSCCC